MAPPLTRRLPRTQENSRKNVCKSTTTSPASSVSLELSHRECCHLCGQTGHVSADCHQRVCHLCGEAGHLARDCKNGGRRGAHSGLGSRDPAHGDARQGALPAGARTSSSTGGAGICRGPHERRSALAALRGADVEDQELWLVRCMVCRKYGSVNCCVGGRSQAASLSGWFDESLADEEEYTGGGSRSSDSSSGGGGGGHHHHHHRGVYGDSSEEDEDEGVDEDDDDEALARYRTASFADTDLYCCNCGDVGHDLSECREETFNALAQHLSHQRDDRDGRACFRCGQVGHIAAKCPLRECFKCGKPGHLAAACPNGNQRRSNAAPRRRPSPPPPPPSSRAAAASSKGVFPGARRAKRGTSHAAGQQGGAVCGKGRAPPRRETAAKRAPKAAGTGKAASKKSERPGHGGEATLGKKRKRSCNGTPDSSRSHSSGSSKKETSKASTSKRARKVAATSSPHAVVPAAAPGSDIFSKRHLRDIFASATAKRSKTKLAAARAERDGAHKPKPKPKPKGHGKLAMTSERRSSPQLRTALKKAKARRGGAAPGKRRNNSSLSKMQWRS